MTLNRHFFETSFSLFYSIISLYEENKEFFMMNFTGNPYLTGGALMTPQQRLMQMEAQYPQYAQPQQQSFQPMINTAFVTDIQEAKAQPITLNCTNLSIDNNNNCIYKKTMDNNGKSLVITYIPQKDDSSPVDEYNPQEGINLLKDELASLKSDVSGLKNDFHKGIVNLSVEIENIINSSVENQLKKMKGEKSVK